MKGTSARRALVVATAALMTLTACSSTEQDVRDYAAENYERVTENGSYEAYRTDDSVDTVADDIESVASPGREHDDETGRYLGYEDVMVHIESDPGGSGSTIEVTDASDGYDRWGPAIIPIWGTFGGSYRSGFSGGGSGFGGK